MQRLFLTKEKKHPSGQDPLGCFDFEWYGMDPCRFAVRSKRLFFYCSLKITVPLSASMASTMARDST